MSRALRLIPLLALLWAGVEVRGLTAQAPADSLIATALVRRVVGEWRADAPITAYCVTWSAEREHLLILLDAVVADTTVRPLCAREHAGLSPLPYPLLIDAPICPVDIPVTDREWVIVRCGENAFQRYRRR